MSLFILQRFFQALIVLVLVTCIVFFGLRLLPGDPILMIINSQSYQAMDEKEIAIMRHEAGLDKPLIVQYGDWMNGVLHGDMGRSILSKVEVKDEIARRIPITLYLGFLALALGIIIGIPAGVICAVRRASWLDNVITVLSNIGITVPVFLLGFFLVYIFGVKLAWLPIMGFTSPFEDFWLNLKQIIMPVLCLSIFPIGGIARQTRSSMLEVMHQDYIRTAWAKGLREQWVVARHALKNGLIPVVTMLGMELSQVIGGSVIVETIFVIPGMGLLLVSSVTNHDYPYVQAVTIIVAVAVVVLNFLTELAYGWFDPRIRYK